MRTRHFARILLLTLSWSKLSKWLFSADGCQGWQWNYRWLCVRSRLYRDIRRSRCREWRSAHFRHHQGFCRFLTQINIDLRSGYLTWHSYGKWPICRWCTDVPIKMVSFHGYVKQPKGILIYILCLLCESLSNFWRSLRLRCSIFGSLLGSCPRLWRFSGMPKLGCSLGNLLYPVLLISAIDLSLEPSIFVHWSWLQTTSTCWSPRPFMNWLMLLAVESNVLKFLLDKGPLVPETSGFWWFWMVLMVFASQLLQTRRPKQCSSDGCCSFVASTPKATLFFPSDSDASISCTDCTEWRVWCCLGSLFGFVWCVRVPLGPGFQHTRTSRTSATPMARQSFLDW